MQLEMSTRVAHIPKMTGDVTIYYPGENSPLTAAQFNFGQVSFTARKQSALVQVSNELIRDSAPAADAIIRQQAGLAIARDRDKQAIFGNGQNGLPVGLINVTNVGTYTATGSGSGTGTGSGSAFAYNDLHTIIYNVENLNGSTNAPVGQAECTGMLSAVRLKQAIWGFMDSNNRPLWEYGISTIGKVPTPGFLGVDKWALSNLVPTNVSLGGTSDGYYVIGGDWQYGILMVRQDLEFMASDVAGNAFQNDQTWLRLIYRYDFGCMHPEAFCVGTGR